ncbi:MAG TPA: EpsI family protein [Pyrinomonadaceae bacterium]
MKTGIEKRFWILLAALLMCGAVVNLWERAGEAKVSRQALKNFPAQVGQWKQKGDDLRFDKETEDVLRADDYLSRNYETADGRTVSFYVGYYASQRTGATYHSPLNCLPGAGWVLTDIGRIKIQPAGDRPAFEANRYLVQNGKDRALMLYWYEGRGRPLASEYWGKIYTLVDSLRRRRSDGGMVRVMVPLGNSQEAAQASATDIASKAAAQMPAFVPD